MLHTLSILLEVFYKCKLLPLLLTAFTDMHSLAFHKENHQKFYMLPFSQPPEFFCASLSFERNGCACRTSLHACFTVLHHWFLQRPPCSWGSCVGLNLDMMWDLQMVLTPLIIALLQHKLKVTLKVSWGWVGLMLGLAKVHLKILGFLNVYTVISPHLALPHRSGANFDILLHFLFLNIKYNTC